MLRIFFTELLKSSTGKAFRLACWVMDVSRYAEGTLAVLFFLLVSVLAQAQQPPWTLCPDGKYYPAGECRLCPDGQYTTAPTCSLNPRGQWAPDYGSGWRLTPRGDYIPETGNMVLCPDNEYHAGTSCYLLPDGRYIGEQTQTYP